MFGEGKLRLILKKKLNQVYTLSKHCTTKFKLYYLIKININRKKRINLLQFHSCGFVHNYSDFYHLLHIPYSLGRTLKTTGTLVHGNIAISVTTAVIRSEVVTSYRRLNGVRYRLFNHCSLGITSFLSPKINGIMF